MIKNNQLINLMIKFQKLMNCINNKKTKIKINKFK